MIELSSAIDLVGGGQKPIAARCGDILGERENRHVVLGRQRADPPGDQRRLHRRSAGRIDGKRHGLEVGQFEGALEDAGKAAQAEAAAQHVEPADDPEKTDHGDPRWRVAKAFERQKRQKGSDFHAAGSFSGGMAKVKGRCAASRQGVGHRMAQHRVGLVGEGATGLMQDQPRNQAERCPGTPASGHDHPFRRLSAFAAWPQGEHDYTAETPGHCLEEGIAADRRGGSTSPFPSGPPSADKT